jgi:hypothetical protein
MTYKTAFTVLALTPFFAGAALADDRCGNTPAAEWKSVVEVATIATEAGYTVREVERDDGCYDLKVTDKNGQRFELEIHPRTGEIIRTDRD